MLLNHHNREINCKIVYYGPGFCGKTTTLQFIHSQLSPTTRGEMISMATQTDRTLYFDFLPLDLGEINGWKVRFSLYTVPGQVEYDVSRKLILNGADATVFVADSDFSRSADNIQSLQNMVKHLDGFGISINKFPWLLQYNKRDLTTAMPIERLEQELNTLNVPSCQSVASEGLGVFATLRGISKLVFDHLSNTL